MKKEDNKIEVQVTPLNLKKIKVKIEGMGQGLMMDKFPEEVRQSVINKQTTGKKGVKKLRDIDKEIQNAIYYIGPKQVGFPIGGIKSGMIQATSFVGGRDFSQKLLKHVQITNQINGLIPIKYKKQTVVKHTPKPGQTKFSPVFEGWEMELEIAYDANNISDSDITNLLNYSGLYCGLGAWSPKSKCGGPYGMYQLKYGK